MNRNIEIHLREKIEIDADGNASCRRLYTFYNRQTKSISIDEILNLSLHKDAELQSVDATADVVPAVKPQVAFFERLGPPGFEALEQIVSAAKRRDLLVISDSKRGDIGSTASAYADYHLGSVAGHGTHLAGLGADAMTLSPYLGEDSLTPFANYIAQGRGLFILAKSSNKGSSDFQDRKIEQDKSHVPLYHAVASLAQALADRYPLGVHGYSSVGIVVGATFPTQASELRIAFPRLFFLVPGVGHRALSPATLEVAQSGWPGRNCKCFPKYSLRVP